MSGEQHTSWSEVDTSRQCLKKHHLVYRESWEPKITPPALIKGNAWHALLEELYVTKRAEAPYEKLISMLLSGEIEDDVGDLMKWMIDGYYQAYGHGDPDWTEATILVEHEINFELPDVGYGPLKLKGFIDLVVILFGKLWIVDHKSGKNKPSDGELALIDQWPVYIAALQEEGYDVFGSIHSYAKTDRLKRDQPMAERFLRTPIQRTPLEVKTALSELTVQAWIAKLGVEGNPMSPGEYCRWRCSFQDSCIAYRKWGADMETQVLKSKHIQTERRANEYK